MSEASPKWAVLTHGEASKGVLICSSAILCLFYSKHGHYLFKMSITCVQMFCVMWHRWGEHEGHAGGERSFALYPPPLDAGTLASRKSSSSTDSSSSHSLHSRSTTGYEGGAVSVDSFLCRMLHSYHFCDASTINKAPYSILGICFQWSYIPLSFSHSAVM